MSLAPGRGPSPVPFALQSGEFIPRGELISNLAYSRALAGLNGVTHVLMQLAASRDEFQEQALESLGVRFMGLVPARTYLAALPDQVGPGELERAGVTWVGAIYPEDKTSRRIAEQGVGSWAMEADGTAHLRIKYFDDVSAQSAVDESRRFGAEDIHRVDALHEVKIRLPADLLGELLKADWVRWVEEAPPPAIPMNDGVRTNTGAEIVQTWPDGLSGAGVTLGVWDEGNVDSGHPDFAGRVILAEPGGVVALHATHVAGTMAGNGARSVDFGGSPGQWRGMAPEARIVSYDFAEPIPEHDEAINTYNIVASQNSWGFRIAEFMRNCDLYGDYSQFAPEYDQIVDGLYGKPISVLFAAGNYRQGSSTNDCGAGPYRTIGPPGTAKNILTVGAIQSDDNAMAFFSSWGPVDDGRLKPELVAPGAQASGDGGVTSTVPGNGYAVRQGTSMATPAVTGAVGLFVEDYRNLNNQRDPLPSTVRALLVHSALDLNTGDGYLNRGPDYASGYGRLQIQGAIEQLRGDGYLAGSLEPGRTNTYWLDVPAGTAEVKLTLAWDDPAAIENAAIALVNDLDLVVLDPQGTRYFPWTLDPENPSMPATRNRPDRVNVIEQVVVDSPPVSGQWQIQIAGDGIHDGHPQRYSLAFTPVGIPPTPALETISRRVSDRQPGSGNGDGVIDPGETIALNVDLEHLGGPRATNVFVTVSSSTPGVTVIEPVAEFPDFDVGDRVTTLNPILVRVDKQIGCGTKMEFTEIVDAGGTLFSNNFWEVVGRVGVTNQTVGSFESVGPVPLPDRETTISEVTVPVVGNVTHARVAVRIDHPWHGDLRLELEHPDGTTVMLVEASGNSGADFGSGPCGGGGGAPNLTTMRPSPFREAAPHSWASFVPLNPCPFSSGKRLREPGDCGSRIWPRRMKGCYFAGV